MVLCSKQQKNRQEHKGSEATLSFLLIHVFFAPSTSWVWGTLGSSCPFTMNRA
jgi:hypothetical protein